MDVFSHLERSYLKRERERERDFNTIRKDCIKFERNLYIFRWSKSKVRSMNEKEIATFYFSPERKKERKRETGRETGDRRTSRYEIKDGNENREETRGVRRRRDTEEIQKRLHG